ncbi:GHKL domain-containing protein [Vagococcus fluvialis]|uniref:GHKL domain-containing protein n=1 Tax=Vagococcus fluvialis TaxID=2738 RepID=UPI00203447A2|nr:GHKL domain-containing protein [Vagococcus fluvialis]MCM2139849.1 GHKL domain-containing protein [Vagococcus fluvialis]
MILFFNTGLFAIILFLIVNLYIEDNKVKQKTIDTLNNYNVSLELYYEELSMFKHDYANLLYTMKIAIENKDFESINSIFNDVLAPTEKIINHKNYELITLNNLKTIELRSIISLKMITAEKNNIFIDLEIPKSFWLTDKAEKIIVIRVLSILLDNAIENHDCSSNKHINLAIFDDINFQEIIIENKFNPSKTKKRKIDPNRGWGLKYVAEICLENKNYDLQTTIKDKTYKQNFYIFKN